MKTVGTKLDNSEYKIFEFCCNDLGLTKSETLRDLIKTFVNNNPNDESDDEPNDEPNDERSEINYEDSKIKTDGIITRVSYDDGQTWIDIPELTNVTVSD